VLRNAPGHHASAVLRFPVQVQAERFVSAVAPTVCVLYLCTDRYAWGLSSQQAVPVPCCTKEEELVLILCCG
jgi:hypothetical protein